MNVKNTNLRLLIIIAIIVTTVLSATYAFINMFASSTTEEEEAGCFVVDYKGEILTSDALTSTINYNDAGTHHATVTLNQNSNCKIYTEATISLHTNSTNTAPLNGTPALKYTVLSGSTIIASGIINNPEDTSDIPTDFSVDLATDIELTSTAKKYDIYIWLDKSISLGEYHGKTYSGYIYATSEQTSGIED